jgi:hypothetical protein
MQAMVVFLLELPYGGAHMTTQDNEDIPIDILKTDLNTVSEGMRNPSRLTKLVFIYSAAE